MLHISINNNIQAQISPPFSHSNKSCSTKYLIIVSLYLIYSVYKRGYCHNIAPCVTMRADLRVRNHRIIESHARLA